MVMISKKDNKKGFCLENKRQIRNFELIKKWEAGIILEGWAVKAILANNLSLFNSYVYLNKNDEVFWRPFSNKKTANSPNNIKEFKLLLHKSEIRQLKAQVQEKKFTIIPVKIYLKKNRLKLEIALAKGLKKYQKKAKIITQDLRKKHQKLGKILKT